MNAFPTIDMQDVTRLTREGRLDEAMALLQGRARRAAQPDRTQSASAPTEGFAGTDAFHPATATGPKIDLERPKPGSGNTWTSAGEAFDDGAAAVPARSGEHTPFADTTRSTARSPRLAGSAIPQGGPSGPDRGGLSGWGKLPGLDGLSAFGGLSGLGNFSAQQASPAARPLTLLPGARFETLTYPSPEGDAALQAFHSGEP